MSLSPFAGRDVVGTPIVIRKAGDGLSAALKVDPAEYDLDATVYVVLKTKCTGINFKDADPNDAEAGLNRIHVLTTELATVVDEKVVKAALAEAQKRLDAAKEIEGQQRAEELLGD